MSADLDDFKNSEVPTRHDVVYVLYYRKTDEPAEIPFYVGESSRHLGRLGDYLSAKFSAPTDFKVGEAIRQLRLLGFHVGIKYREASNRKTEEKEVLERLRPQFRLLNDLRGYDYMRSNEEEQRSRIHDFVKEMIGSIDHTQNDDLSSSDLGKGTKSTSTSKVGRKRHSSIAERIEAICEELGADGRIIERKEILHSAKRIGINESSVLPADYCDNTVTGKWSRYSFLHSVGPGRYVLHRFSGEAKE